MFDTKESKEKMLVTIGRLIFIASYMVLGLMAFSGHFSNAELLTVALPFILIHTISPIYKIRYRMQKPIWMFLCMVILVPFINVVSVTEPQPDRILFCATLAYLLLGYFGPKFLGLNRRITIVALTGMRILLISLPYLWPEIDMGVMREAAVKDAVVVSILVDTLTEKYKKI